MGWIQALCKTYDNLAGAFNDAENPLIPVGFTQMQPAYYVALTQEGEVDRIAQWPEKEKAKRIIRNIWKRFRHGALSPARRKRCGCFAPIFPGARLQETCKRSSPGWS